MKMQQPKYCADFQIGSVCSCYCRKPTVLSYTTTFIQLQLLSLSKNHEFAEISFNLVKEPNICLRRCAQVSLVPIKQFWCDHYTIIDRLCGNFQE